MGTRAFRFSVLLLFVMTGLLFAQAEERQVAVAGESVQVNLVEIPVNVFDRTGSAIRGLKPENFEVFDDGKRRKITHFEEIDLATISTAQPVVHNPAARRNFLLIFDLSHSSQTGLQRAKTAARQFLSDSLQDRDLAAVATFGVERGLIIMTAFTTDRGLLDDAVRNIGNLKFMESRDPLLLASLPDPGLSQSGGLEDPRGIELQTQELDRIVQIQIQSSDQRYARTRIEKQLRTFGELARMLDRVHGRKQVILLSEGFDSALIQGRGASTTDEEAIALLRGEIWKFDSDYMFGSTEALRELDTMSLLFRRSDVVMHAIDIKGIRGPSDARAGSQQKKLDPSESLFLLTDGTGGELLKNENDLAATFARMLKQQEVIYVLGFQTQPSGNPGKFHDLKVKVRVVGYSGLRVSHRAGYYEPRLQMSAMEQLLSATDILMNDIPFQDVKATLLATPFPLPGADAAVPVVVEINGESLLGTVKSDNLNAEIFVYAFDRHNSVKDYLFQTVSLDLKTLRDTLRRTGLKYYGTLTLPPGDYTMKTLVRVVESGMNGFHRVPLHVPTPGEPSLLPPLFFEEPGKWIMLKGASKAEENLTYPFMIAGESFIPTPHPVLTNERSHKLALFTYNVPAEQMRLSAIIRDEAGKSRNARLTLVGRTSPDEHGSVKLLLEFVPEQLASGNYMFDVTMQRSDQERAETVSIPVRVE
jgi:VWFA-related protein